MPSFGAAYKKAERLTVAAVKSPKDPALRVDAEDALQALRQAYKELNPEERKRVRDKASHLSQQLADVPPPALARTERKEISVRSAQRRGLSDEEFARALRSAPEQFSLEEYLNIPSRLFSGIPTPEALLDHFGYPSFREGQREALEAALSGRDSLIIMPTGGGKSLCYQLAGMATSDLTVVVTPLVALMRDQYERLARDGHPAVMLAAGLSESYNRDALAQIRDGEARMVFCAPERFASSSFVNALESRRIALFVVDEAHCVSEWGHDFRPEYLRLHRAIEHLGRPTVMACTATATPQVAREIAQRLQLKQPLLVHSGFNRPNLSFDVVSFGGAGAAEEKMRTLYAGLQGKDMLPAIVYCGTRRDVEKVAEHLQGGGLQAIGYHAGMASEQRTNAQQGFMNGTYEVVVATNAFGMGVDKADVRSVWHWAIPTSLEAYYQEAGRAGRDGKIAHAVLLAMRADLGRLVAFNKGRSTTLGAVQAYLDSLRSAARGQEEVLIDPPTDDKERLALAVAERAHALDFQAARGGKLLVRIHGALNRDVAARCCQIAKNRGWEAYRTMERFVSTHNVCRRRQLLEHFGDCHEPYAEGRCCDVCDPAHWLPAPRALPKSSGSVKKHNTSPKNMQAPAGSLLEALIAWRKEVAGGRPAYQIAKNFTLEEIARTHPKTPLELLEIHGVGPKFLSKYSKDVLELVANC